MSSRRWGLPAYIGDAVITPLNERLDQMEKSIDGRFSQVDERFDRIDTYLGDIRSVIFGDHNVREARDEVPARLGEIVSNPTKVSILVCLMDGTGVYEGFYREGVDQAAAQGMFKNAPEDKLRLDKTDMVITAMVGEESRMFPVEVSTTIDNEDVTRAKRSSVLITKIFDVPSTPVVAGPDIRHTTRVYAEQSGVAVIILGAEESA